MEHCFVGRDVVIIELRESIIQFCDALGLVIQKTEVDALLK